MSLPKKKYGQHFLSDPRILTRIADAANLPQGAKVWEIGPGRGALTRILLNKGVDLTAFEIDTDLIPQLQQEFGPELNIVQGDVVRQNWGPLLNSQPFYLVANLPYNITSPVLFKLVEFAPLLKTAVLMIQNEVALRLNAKPGTKNYAAITLKLACWFKLEYLFKVAPGSFNPPPRVDSAVIRLTPREQQPTADTATYFKVLDVAFGARRKMLRVNLKSLLPPDKLTQLAAQLPFGLDKRGESLNEDQLVLLAERLAALR